MTFLGIVAASANAKPDLDDCASQLRQKPRDSASAACFLEAANRDGNREDAASRLETHLEHNSDLPWFRYYLGLLTGGEKALAYFREARDGFEGQGKKLEAFDAQMYLIEYLNAGRRLGEVEAELERAREMLPENDLAGEKLRLGEAVFAALRGNLDDARDALIGIKERVIPGGAPDEFRARLLFQMGRVYYELGRFQEAGEYIERSADITRALDDRYHEAPTIYMVGSIAAEQSGKENRERVIGLYHRALESATVVGRIRTSALAHLELGKLLPERQERLYHLNKCLSLEGRLRKSILSNCLGAHAFELAEENPEEARRVMERAIAVAQEAQEARDPWASIYLWSYRLPVSWRTLSPEQAYQGSLETLRHIEKLRESHLDDEASVGYFSVWAKAYSWLVGRLLDGPDLSERREDLEKAFEVVERYRSRVLLERLRETGAWPDLPDDRQDEVRTLPGGTLDQVEATLQKDEAMLVFQLGDWMDIYGRFAGGTWLFAVTRTGTRVYRLGDRADLEKRVTEFQESLTPALGRDLYGKLFGEALEELPVGIDKLLIVPDNALHRLPFGALHPDGSEPLAVRYELSLVPSANIWLGWRSSETGPGPALVLADPARPAPEPVDDAASTGRSEAFLNGLRWCRQLPYARAEGEAILRKAGRSSVLRLGEQASEPFLKQEDLTKYGVIHLASHAFVDGRHADRSLICLAPGDGGEDGNLEVREIVNLDLDGQLVVLASCDSASGLRLAGEGVMSLARAFFLAGARTVVASLRSIDDEEARDLFVRFHGHLADGRSASSALRAAKREIFAEKGAHGTTLNSAWTNVVVLGDGALRPLRAEPVAFLGLSWPWWVAVAFVIYLISIGVRIWLQRR